MDAWIAKELIVYNEISYVHPSRERKKMHFRMNLKIIRTHTYRAQSI